MSEFISALLEGLATFLSCDAILPLVACVSIACILKAVHSFIK